MTPHTVNMMTKKGHNPEFRSMVDCNIQNRGGEILVFLPCIKVDSHQLDVGGELIAFAPGVGGGGGGRWLGEESTTGCGEARATIVSTNSLIALQFGFDQQNQHFIVFALVCSWI